MNALVSFRKCTLTDEELLKEVDQLTDQMYENGKIPARHIPARPNKDYDLLVGELIYRFNQLLNKPQNPEVCDATTDDKNGEADPQINPDPLGNGELEVYVPVSVDDEWPEKHKLVFTLASNGESLGLNAWFGIKSKIWKFQSTDCDGWETSTRDITHWLKKVKASSIKK